jgi:hypothetical protein
MTKCPKCGGVKILGPTYRRNEYHEVLAYRCFQCGYTATTPTNDAHRQPPVSPGEPT